VVSPILANAYLHYVSEGGTLTVGHLLRKPRLTGSGRHKIDKG